MPVIIKKREKKQENRANSAHFYAVIYENFLLYSIYFNDIFSNIYSICKIKVDFLLFKSNNIFVKSFFYILWSVKMEEISKTNEIVFYQTENSDVVVNVVFKDETFWLTQKAMAALFDVNSQAITKHLANIYEDLELEKSATCSILEQVQKEGNRSVKRLVEFYNLDAIIAVGYRVNSKKATKFRQWATKTLREYITKGFVINEKMLKNGKPFGKDYFDELLEKIREIRASERRAYQKITDIFEQCSCDFDKESETTKEFYAFVQNKLHFAVSGKTAAELVYNRPDASGQGIYFGI